MSAGYAGHTVLHEVTTEIPGGRVTAIVGPNGSGKSTLLGVLAGIVATTGTVDYVRPDPTDETPRPARRPSLVVQQSAIPETLPITVRDTVAMGRWADRGPWRRLTRTDRTLIDTCMERMGVAALSHRRMTALSGGQRQRTLLAQALAQQSDLLLLDEPATGLDAEAQQDISRLLHSLAADGTTIVQTTHDPQEAHRAHHRLQLRAGHLTPAPAAHPSV